MQVTISDFEHRRDTVLRAVSWYAGTFGATFCVCLRDNSACRDSIYWKWLCGGF